MGHVRDEPLFYFTKYDYGWQQSLHEMVHGFTKPLYEHWGIGKNFVMLCIAGALTIGAIGMIMDRLILAPLERRTIERWGLVGSDQ